MFLLNEPKKSGGERDRQKKLHHTLHFQKARAGGCVPVHWTLFVIASAVPHHCKLEKLINSGRWRTFFFCQREELDSSITFGKTSGNFTISPRRLAAILTIGIPRKKEVSHERRRSISQWKKRDWASQFFLSILFCAPSVAQRPTFLLLSWVDRLPSLFLIGFSIRGFHDWISSSCRQF